MKLFISADIEGCTGVGAWSETEYGGKGYEEACRQMSLETAAACRAAMAAGYDVIVKDGHGDARNIDPNQLPTGVQLISGWMQSPLAMMAGLDDTYDAAAYIGYHAGSHSDSNPLSHTIEHTPFNWMKLNGVMASEFTLNAILADQMGVPSVFLSGDRGICEEAAGEYPGLRTFATKAGIGDATWNLHPVDAIVGIEQEMAKALENKAPVRKLESSYTIEVNFKRHQDARTAAWYPGAERIDTFTVAYTAPDPISMATARMFMTGI